MGDVYDAMNRPLPSAAGPSGTAPAAEVPGLPLTEMESIARVQPGKSLHNEQPLNLRMTTAEVDAGGFGQASGNRCVPNVITHRNRTGPAAEQYRQIRTQILARSKEKSARTYLLTSAVAQEGRSTTTVNLGVVFSERTQSRTLLIEADLRQPGFQRIFNRPFLLGLSHVLRGDLEDEIEAIHPTVYSNLDIMPAGESDGQSVNQLLGSRAMVRVLDRLKDRYDHILIDSPPVLRVSDACMIAALCDETILVVRMHKTPRDVVRQAKRQLESAGCTLAGAIMTHVQQDQTPQYFDQYDA